MRLIPSRGKERSLLVDNRYSSAQNPFEQTATNGREYLEQLHTKSGIWFCDVRNSHNLRRPLQGWKSPEGLVKLLQQDKEKAHDKLEKEDFNYNIELILLLYTLLRYLATLYILTAIVKL